MKKLLTVMFLFGAVLVTQAQTSKGSIMLGGGLSFSTQTAKFGTTTSDPVTSFSISPRIGYFLADKIVVGLEGGFTTYNYDFFGDSSDEGNTTIFAVGPFARYYVPTASENFAFYAQASFLYGSVKFNPDNSTADTDPTNTINIGISPGFTFFPTPKVGIDLQLAGLQYQSLSSGEGDFKYSQSALTFGIESLSPSVGLHFFF